MRIHYASVFRKTTYEYDASPFQYEFEFGGTKYFYMTCITSVVSLQVI